MNRVGLVLVAAVVSVLVGATSCAQRADTSEKGTATEPRVQVGQDVGGFAGATEPYRVPLEDSLAALRQRPAGTPKFGESVYVTALPKPVERHAPVRPESAKGVGGRVIVHTLVLRDGTVGETWIIQSIPELDEAAAHSVQRWRFTPALDRDQPVAVWIAVPVDFTAASN